MMKIGKGSNSLIYKTECTFSYFVYNVGEVN